MWVIVLRTKKNYKTGTIAMGKVLSKGRKYQIVIMSVLTKDETDIKQVCVLMGAEQCGTKPTG